LSWPAKQANAAVDDINEIIAVSDAEGRLPVHQARYRFVETDDELSGESSAARQFVVGN
jgi:hypothetical protein